MKEIDLDSILIKTRSRLAEFRLKNLSDGISIHINSMEIVICLVEFSLKTNPPRSISKEEEQWFNAGYYLDLILGNSEWADITDLYYKIVEEVKKRNFFR